MKTLIISSVLLLAGCCPNTVIPSSPKFDSYLMSECDKLSSKTINSWEDVLAEKAQNNVVFSQCANKHKGLIKSIEAYQRELDATK